MSNKSIEQQVADARKESIAFQEGEWDSDVEKCCKIVNLRCHSNKQQPL